MILATPQQNALTALLDVQTKPVNGMYPDINTEIHYQQVKKIAGVAEFTQAQKLQILNAFEAYKKSPVHATYLGTLAVI